MQLHPKTLPVSDPLHLQLVEHHVVVELVDPPKLLVVVLGVLVDVVDLPSHKVGPRCHQRG